MKNMDLIELYNFESASNSSSLDAWFSYFEQKEIPPYTPEEIKNDMFAFSMYRENYIKNAGYLLLDRGWISELAAFIGERKVLEIMAGSGALSVALEKEGVNVVATTDDFTWGFNNPQFSYWKQIEDMSAISAIEKYKDVDIIICSWPPHKSEAIIEALYKMREVNPDAMFLYIGENYSGDDEDGKFFTIAKKIRDDLLEEIQIPSWYAIYDELMLFQ